MDHLRRDDSAGGLFPAAERIFQIQQDLNRLLPAGFREGCSVCQLNDGELTLAIASVAMASKIRQTLPRLREGLEHQGWKVNSIGLRVQPSNISDKSKDYDIRAKVAKVPGSAFEHIEALAEALRPSALKDAVTRLLRHRAGPK